MSQERLVRLSKFLSFVLRHKPESIGLVLDAEGWASVEELIARSREHGTGMGVDELFEVVETNDKKRFTLTEDRSRIRAAQGHSVKVELGLPAVQPPTVLYHGTAERFVEQIVREGLKPQSRQHVHLSVDVATARKVGARHGRAVVLRIDTQGMSARGCEFFRADNGVWLTQRVPREFIERVTTEGGDGGEKTTEKTLK